MQYITPFLCIERVTIDCDVGRMHVSMARTYCVNLGLGDKQNTISEPHRQQNFLNDWLIRPMQMKCTQQNMVWSFSVYLVI
jgi:hypothetical protein